MGALRIAALWIFFGWILVDGIVVFGRRAPRETRADRLSMGAIVAAVWFGVALAIPLGFLGIGSLGPRGTVVLQVMGLILLAIGITIRSVAIAQLGRFHMPVVAIREDHKVVTTGLYCVVRHPSYLGGTIAMVGFGAALGSWIGALVLCAFALAAYSYRIHVEEQALLAALGAEYAAYRERTRRLVPFVY